MSHNPDSGPRDVVSVRLEGALADEVNRIAEERGRSRSEILRQLLLRSIQSQDPPTIRCIRQLWTIHGQLQQIAADLEDEEEEAAESVQNAVASVSDSLEELGEEFEDEDE